jgi:ABC-2 type transport system ATP-binding protein
MSSGANDAATPVLAAEGLCMRYPGLPTPALDHVSLQVHAGQIFGLLGPNGAGKTTAVGVMGTLLKASAGRVLINGADTLRHRNRARRAIGLVPQEIALFFQLSARENVLYFGRMYGLHGAALQAAAHRVLAAVGLAEQADRQVGVYSGGMQRRANLAVGLVHDPPLLFLDEPTVGVDAQSRALIMDLIAGHRATGGCAVFTTHYMEEAEKLCDTVAVLDHGRIIDSGTPAALLQRHAAASLGEVFLKLTGRELRD